MKILKWTASQTVAVALCLAPEILNGQAAATTTPPADTPYAVTARDASQNVWERTTYEQSPSGAWVPHNHRYIELATGLNHTNSLGQWTPSDDHIDILPDGSAAATNGQHQVYFPPDIYNGQIQLVMPDGRALVSQPLGLSYDDGSNTVWIAVLTNSIGELVSPNVIVYPNAFYGVNADLRYTYTKAGLEQDVIIREQPPAPDTLNLNSQTTRLQVITEFFNPPQPTVTVTPLAAQGGMTLDDDFLDFGAMKMIPGMAFLMGTDGHNIGAQVAKTWISVSGRQILVEQVPVIAVADELSQLPSPQTSKANFPSPFRIAPARRLLPQRQDYNSQLTTYYLSGGSPDAPDFTANATVVMTPQDWNNNMTLNNWHHFRSVYKSLGGTNAQTTVYIDGTYTNTVASPVVNTYTEDWILYLGNFDGYIDEVRISSIDRGSDLSQ